MNRKNLWLIIGAVVVIIAIIIGIRYAITRPTVEVAQEYKIGAIVFLTGPQAPLGAEVQNALRVAQEELNEKGGVNGKKINILYEDSKDSPRDAIAAFNRLETQNVPVIISTGDVVSLNLTPIVDEKKIPMIATVAAGPDIPQKSDWVFRVFIQATRQAETMGSYAAQQLRMKSAAVLSINNEFGVATSGKFKETFERLGGKVTGAETFGVADRDVRAQVTKLKAANPDAIYITGFGDGYAACIKQVRELKFAGTILSDSSLSIPYFQQQTTPANEGAYFTSTLFDANYEQQQARGFFARYRAKFNSDPGFVGAFAYDSLNLIAAALARGDDTPKGIRDSLLSLKDYQGAIGKMSFDAQGEVSFPLVVRKMQNGKAVTVSGGQ
jgi:branched-chain amino acid transport system substrate-binding protein